MKTFIVSLFLVMAAFGLWGCDGAGGEGRLSVSLSSNSGGSGGGSAAALNTSSPEVDLQTVEGVFVTIESVKVHLDGEDADEEGDADEADDGEEDEGGWVTVASFEEGKTVNLLDLRNCIFERLGEITLPAGRSVSEIRLVLMAEGNFIRFASGEEQDVKFPSAYTSGLKIKLQGENAVVSENGELHIVVRIDLAHSLVFTGNGKILFKPVLHATVGGPDADSFISGRVTKAADDSALAGATVTAHSAEDAEVESSEETDTEGNYELCVAPGSYDVTASEEGYQDATARVDVGGEETVTADFHLEAL
ncbi:MAG TPA: DUF4382 domain-containing protein [bacterium]|nr:DUF4382 domain-containing protein [bacterium]